MRSLSFFRLLLLLLLFFVVDQSVSAQAINYRYEIKFKDKNHPDKKIVRKVHLMHSMLPDKVKNVYQTANAYRQQQILGDHLQELGFKSSMGKFVFTGKNGMGVIIFDEEKNELYKLTNDDGNWKNKGLGVEGLTGSCEKISEREYAYEVVIEDNSATREDVKVDGKDKTPEVPPRNVDLKDGYDRFECHLLIPDSFATSSARIIIRPYALDCQTEDTIAYLRPAAYEGEEYHKLQDKRKAFDYDVYDPVGLTYYTNEIVENVDTFKVERTWKELKYLTDDNGNPLLDEDGFQRQEQVIRRELEDSLVVTSDTVHVMHSGYIAKIDTLKREQGMIHIDTTIVFRRPIKDRRNRGLVKYTVEDYHHVMKPYSGFDPGTCLSIDPFKFLDMATAMTNFELLPEFQEPADETPDSIDKDIPIQFYYNSANVIEDSVYMISIRRLEHDMHDIITHGGVLTNATITGYASPDGPPEKNMSLARQRAQAARGKINAPGGSRIEIVAKIDTWEHTAELLEKAGYVNEAQMVRDALASTKTNKAAEDIIKKSQSYKDIIKPILEKQCRINFSYQYFSERRLEPEEAVDYYYRDKHRLFSNGDYYNLFYSITDENELDTLTEIAYDRIIVQKEDYLSPFAPYIVNRKAVLNAKLGILDSTVLQPLIYEGLKSFRINYRKEAGGILYNRPEILLNQAVLFFQAHEVQRAKMFLNRLRRAGYQNPNMEKLNKFINFQTLYQIAPDRRSKKQNDDFKEALAYVESIPGNKAVLYTEFDGLKKQKTEAWEWVHLMDDANPRKWYLMGILWAVNEKLQSNSPLPTGGEEALIDIDNPVLPEDEEDALKELDMESYNAYLVKKQEYLQKVEEYKAKMKQMDVDDADVKVDGIPYYLAYFWKSFDIERERLKQAGVHEDELDVKNLFMKYYFNEGYVSEKMRKKKNHAFKKSKIPAYKKLFRLCKINDDKKRMEFRKKHNLDLPAEEEVDEQNQETEAQSGNE